MELSIKTDVVIWDNRKNINDRKYAFLCERIETWDDNNNFYVKLNGCWTRFDLGHTIRFSDLDIKKIPIGCIYITADEVKMLDTGEVDFTTLKRFENITEIKNLNKKTGSYWFNTDNIKHWGCKIVSKVFCGRLFITSEYLGYNNKNRGFTIRYASPGGKIANISDFNQFKTLKKAKEWEGS